MVHRQQPDTVLLAVISKVREWYDFGKLDDEKTVWELEADRAAWSPTEKRETPHPPDCRLL